VLAGQATATAKAGDGPVEMIRMFKLAKASAIKARTQAINQLKAVLVGADPVLREKLSGLSSTLLVRRCAELDAGASGSPNRLLCGLARHSGTPWRVCLLLGRSSLVLVLARA
jgi:transposase